MRRRVAQISPGGGNMLTKGLPQTLTSSSSFVAGRVGNWSLLSPSMLLVRSGNNGPSLRFWTTAFFSAAGLARRWAQFVLRLHMHVGHAAAPPTPLTEHSHVTRRRTVSRTRRQRLGQQRPPAVGWRKCTHRRWGGSGVGWGGG